jgi:two-component system secretion response regulator SsrB
MVGEGCTSREISELLGIRLNTVEVHRANLMRKLDASNAANLARWAVIASQMPLSAR